MSQRDGTTERTIEIAEGAGVCFGVKRALRLAEEALAADTPVCSLGPLIHNPQEVGRLTEKGFQVIETLDEAPAGATLLIRSHGVSPDVVAEAKRRGHAVIDATCPLVRRVQTLATDLEQEGYQVIVAGDAAHPEVRAIRGHAPSAVVVSDPSAVPDLEAGDRVALVAQTTFSPEVFRQMAAALVGRDFGEVRVVRTICTATVARQRASSDLAERVDLMIVIGGRNSANTNRLAERCAAHGVPTHHVEVADEVEPGWLAGRPRVGVTAGASTPQWIIDAVCDRIRRLQSGMDEGKV
jgi:4-hydroxy-3-methylbut-2-enyl diphosphate reductase